MIVMQFQPCYAFINKEEVHMSKSKKLLVEQPNVVAMSDLGISEAGHEEILNSDITFGGADATLVTLDTLLNGNNRFMAGTLEWSAKDKAILRRLVKEYGKFLYVDLER
jgi:hypothetical protein